MATAEEVLAAALQLYPEERASIAEQLLASLATDRETPLPAEWQQELSWRCQELEDGSVVAVPASEAWERARESLR